MEGKKVQLTTKAIDSKEKILFTFCVFADQIQGKNFTNNSYLERLIKDVKLILNHLPDAKNLIQELEREKDNEKKTDIFGKYQK